MGNRNFSSSWSFPFLSEPAAAATQTPLRTYFLFALFFFLFLVNIDKSAKQVMESSVLDQNDPTSKIAPFLCVL